MSTCADLVRRVYPALRAGDEAALLELLHPDFDQTLAAGLPLGLGGRRRGATEAIREGWWPIGAAFAVRADAEEWFEHGATALTVAGHYRGTARSTGREVEASFAHLWRAKEARLTHLLQVTDTALWAEALA